MADCPHKRLSFNHKFVVRDGQAERVYQLEGHCADCGAPMVFVPQPSLSLDEKNFQIPFRMGAPDLMRLMPKLGPAEPVVLGGNRKGMN